MDKIQVSGHRGTRVHEIENTEAAFNYCIDNGVDFIEFDVMQTKDNRLIVFHDYWVNRLFKSKGLIRNFTLDELKRMRYSDGQGIQTLEELFNQVGKKIKLMLEIKSRGIAPQVMSLIHKHGYKRGEILIQSFSGRDILDCHEIDDGFEYGLCMFYLGHLSFDRKNKAKRVHRRKIAPFPVEWLNLMAPMVYDEFMDEISMHKLGVILGQFNPKRHNSLLHGWDVRIINHDDPVGIRNYLIKSGFQKNF